MHALPIHFLVWVHLCVYTPARTGQQLQTQNTRTCCQMQTQTLRTPPTYTHSHTCTSTMTHACSSFAGLTVGSLATQSRWVGAWGGWWTCGGRVSVREEWVWGYAKSVDWWCVSEWRHLPCTDNVTVDTQGPVRASRGSKPGMHISANATQTGFCALSHTMYT